MAIALQFCKFKSTLHIALISVLLLSVETSNAQTVLLPGDVIFVSANSSDDSFEFIPLIDIEEGTHLYFSTAFQNKDLQTESLNESALLFKSSISAGTVVSIGKNIDQRFKIEGNLVFSGRTHLFIYQKDGKRLRYLFGMVWGENSEQNTAASISQKYPSTINQNQLTFLKLGTAANYQYYLRNGASGTAEMLQQFVANPANWRASAQAFPGLGTSFTLLSPPVVLFKNSFSTIAENAGSVTLNVAIFEHNGSRLTVDVTLDSSRSIAGKNDFESFNGVTLNFTGVIGDGSYKVAVPVNNDLIYEGSETGIFSLKNLSKGSFGDFINHSVIILDDENPDLKLLNIQNSVSDHSLIILQNNEKGVISLNGWSLTNNNKVFYFDDDLSILPGEQLIIEFSELDKFFSDLKADSRLMNKSGGELLLSAPDKAVISRMTYKAASAAVDPDVEKAVLPDVNTTLDQWNNQDAVQSVNIAQKGWKWLPGTKDIFQKFPEIEFLYWNEHQQQFKKADAVTKSEEIVFGYFEESFLDKFKKWSDTFNREKLTQNRIELNLSATDVNKNENIDGLEGLNLLHNNLNIEVPVRSFLKELQKINPSLNLSEYLYVMEYLENGRFKISSRSGSELLMPGEPFWLMVKNQQNNISMLVNEEALLNGEAGAEELTQEYPHFSISATNGYYNDRIEIHFANTEDLNSRENLKDISAYPAFELPSLQPFNIAIEQGQDLFSVLNFQREPEQNLSLPVLLSSNSEKIHLEITDWHNIPEEWNLMLVEPKTNKELELHKGFIYLIEKNDHTEPSSEPGKETSMEPAFYLNIYTSADTQEIEEHTIPKELELFQNYPNPFNPYTTITFFMPEPGEVKLSIFNIVGQPVAILVDGTLSEGHQKFEWDATDLPSGMYIYQLEMGNKVLTRKMTLVK